MLFTRSFFNLQFHKDEIIYEASLSSDTAVYFSKVSGNRNLWQWSIRDFRLPLWNEICALFVGFFSE